MNRNRALLPVTATALVIGAGLFSAPAYADTTTVSGTRTCPSGQDLYVTLTTERRARATFFLADRALYSSPVGDTHVYDYNRRGGSWKVTSTGNILTVRDTCIRSNIGREGDE